MLLAGCNQILVYAQLSKQANVLKCAGNPQIRGFMGLLAHQGLAIQFQIPACRAVNACNQVEKCGFSRSIRSNQPMYLSRIHLKSDIMQGHHAAKLFAYMLYTQ